MPIASPRGRENAAVGYTAAAVNASLHTGDPGTTGTAEVSGGGYARRPITWNAGTVDGVLISNELVFNLPASTTVTWCAVWDGSGNFIDKSSVIITTIAAGEVRFMLMYTQS
jgi:hypothetical protein